MPAIPSPPPTSPPSANCSTNAASSPPTSLTTGCTRRRPEQWLKWGVLQCRCRLFRLLLASRRASHRGGYLRPEFEAEPCPLGQNRAAFVRIHLPQKWCINRRVGEDRLDMVC